MAPPGPLGELLGHFQRGAQATDRSTAIDEVVAGWAADVAGGHQAAMYAWRRVDVAELNRRGRKA
jgi:hypothetical protein